jgi:hypothetical protein
MDAPDVAGLIERYTDHPPLATGTQRYTVGDAGGDTFATWQVVQRDCQTGLEGPRNPHAAALGIDHQRVPGFNDVGSGWLRRESGRGFECCAFLCPGFLGVHRDFTILRASAVEGGILCGGNTKVLKTALFNHKQAAVSL